MRALAAAIGVLSICGIASSARADLRPRAALIADERVPPETVRVLVSSLAEEADVMPDDQVRLVADEAGIALDAIESSGELIHALDVVLLVRARLGPRRRLELTFHEPAAGSVFLEHRVVLDRGGHMPEDASLELVRVIEDAVAAGAAVAEGGNIGDEPGAGGDGAQTDEPSSGDGPADDDANEGGLSAYASVGLGVGLRDLEVTPDDAATIMHSASLFPTVALAVGARHDGFAHGRLVLRFDVAYRTSVGLATDEPRQDETLRSVESRAHDLVVTIGARYRLARSERAISLGADAGLRWSAFDLARGIVVPDTSYLGPVVLGVIEVPFGSTRVVGSAAVGMHVALTTGDLDAFDDASAAPIVMARAALRFVLGRGFALSVAYDEVHVLMTNVADTDRRADLSLSFTP